MLAIVHDGGLPVNPTGLHPTGLRGPYSGFQMTKDSIKIKAKGEDDMTLAGRIRIGMAAKGIKSPAELAGKMKLRRQTIHKWMSGQVEKLEPEYLFRLSDVLEMSARWLALKEGAPSKPKEVSMEYERVLDLYDALPDKVRDSWIQSGDALLTAAGEESRAQPFRPKPAASAKR